MNVFICVLRNPWQWNPHMEKDFPDLLDQQIAVSRPGGHPDLHRHPLPCGELSTTFPFLCDQKHRWSESLAWIARLQKSQLPNRVFWVFTTNSVSSVSFKITRTIEILTSHQSSVFLICGTIIFLYFDFLDQNFLMPSSLICQYDLSWNNVLYCIFQLSCKWQKARLSAWPCVL